MPTIFIFFGFRFMFYSNDHEPVHIHVLKDGNEAKYNVSLIKQVYNHGFKKHDIALIESIISENEDIIIDRWKEYLTGKQLWSNTELYESGWMMPMFGLKPPMDGRPDMHSADGRDLRMPPVSNAIVLC